MALFDHRAPAQQPAQVAELPDVVGLVQGQEGEAAQDGTVADRQAHRREGVQVGDTRLVWVGNRRTGTIQVQKRSLTTNTDFTLDNYKQVIGGKTFEIRKPDGTVETVQGNNMVAPFLNSLIVSIPATVIPILIAAFAAYAFAWMKFPGRKAMFILVVGLLVVPLQIALRVLTGRDRRVIHPTQGA